MTAQTIQDAKVIDLASKPTAALVMVTPDIALRWLTRNDENRPIRKSAVARLAADMKAGRWQLTGQAIQFAADGRLLDGQHRLSALVAANVTLPLFVIRGLANEAQKVMDIGVKRAIADQLAMKGVKNSSIISSVAKFVVMVKTGRINQRAQVSDAEVYAFIDGDEVLERASDVSSTLRGRGLDIPPSVTGSAYWLLADAGVPLEDVETFLFDLADMRTAGEGDPRHTLLQRLKTARRNGEKLSQQAYLSLLLRTWNYVRKNQRNTRLQITGKNGVVDIPKIVTR